MPVLADEMQMQLVPETTGNNAELPAADLAQPGSFRWTQIETSDAREEAGAESPLSAKLSRSLVFTADTPETTILAQLRKVAAELVDEARRDENVKSVRFRLRLRCVMQERVKETGALQDASMPWLWTSVDSEPREHTTTRACMVRLQRSVELRDQPVRMAPYEVDLSPVATSDK